MRDCDRKDRAGVVVFLLWTGRSCPLGALQADWFSPAVLAASPRSGSAALLMKGVADGDVRWCPGSDLHRHI